MLRTTRVGNGQSRSIDDVMVELPNSDGSRLLYIDSSTRVKDDGFLHDTNQSWFL